MVMVGRGSARPRRSRLASASLLSALLLMARCGAVDALVSCTPRLSCAVPKAATGGVKRRRGTQWWHRAAAMGCGKEGTKRTGEKVRERSECVCVCVCVRASVHHWPSQRWRCGPQRQRRRPARAYSSVPVERETAAKPHCCSLTAFRRLSSSLSRIALPALPAPTAARPDPPHPHPRQPQGTTRQMVMGGFAIPTGVRQLPGSQRLLVVEQQGTVQIVDLASAPAKRAQYMSLPDVNSSACVARGDGRGPR